MSETKIEKLDRKFELWIEDAKGGREKLGLNPVTLGSRKRLWAIITENGQSYDAPAAIWTFPPDFVVVEDFQPTVDAGLPTQVNTQGPNPVNFVPWTYLGGQPGLPPTQMTVRIICDMEAHDGTWGTVEDDLPVTAPTHSPWCNGYHREHVPSGY